MAKLIGKNIRLRALEPEDIHFLYKTENDEAYWEVSSTLTPFSKHLLQEYLKNSHLDIYEAKQLRLVIENIATREMVGMIDLYDFNPIHSRAGVGILVTEANQNKGYASEALTLLTDYAFQHLNLHQLHANISSDNTKSIALFEKIGFTAVGVQKDWIYSNGAYKDVVKYQKIK